ncbi:protein kinase [Streptomyces sp. NPDC004539]|uniref:protein kinase domain-containing protein n=1 Tax=Streptomyces sp. NPDC004539 TaxID=3154280 RepID=UPI0033B07A20
MTRHPYDAGALPVPKGYRVGRWEVGALIASGAFASVYRARNTRPGDGPWETAALKFLPTGTRTPRQLRHLRELVDREVELLSRLTSPRLIRLYETLTVDDPESPELDGATVLVLEEAEGHLTEGRGRLAEMRGRLAEARGRPDTGAYPAVLAQVCEGLHQLHHAGWVHGDLKPANVLLMKDGSVRLADFSTAAELEGTHAYAPLFTTPDFTPPELLWPEISERGARVRPSADIWAFGVLAHLLLTGTHPLPGATAEARTDASLRYARGTEALRLSPELPLEWREIIEDCLARTHAARLTAEPLLRRVESAAKAPRSPRLRRRGIRRPPRRAVTALLVVGALTGAYLYTESREAGPPYGYHRCPYPSVCFFSDSNGTGEMCSWKNSDPDWLSGKETCAWSADRPVRSIYFNADDSAGFGGVAYFRGRDYVPLGPDVTRPGNSRRTGCTAQRAQGNLAGTYSPLSHQLITKC